MARFNGRHISMIKKRYKAMSTGNLLSLLDSVDTAKEAELIQEELKKRNKKLVGTGKPVFYPPIKSWISTTNKKYVNGLNMQKRKNKRGMRNE